MTGKRTNKSTKNNEVRADLIWSITNKLAGLYKPHEYGLPFQTDPLLKLRILSKQAKALNN